MTLPNCFDAVIMLTWSDWKTEPRSNRYHYATRFARTVPVLFLQHQYLKRSQLTIEPTEIPNIDIVNISIGLNDREITELNQLMHARGIRRPLVWIYDSMNYQPLLDAMPKAFRVYHATEDYLTKTEGWNQGKGKIGDSVIQMLRQVDFMVACTPGVGDGCLTLGGYRGPNVVIENGCDAEYFIDYVDQQAIAKAATKNPVAIFQGGINQRLDYELLLQLIKRMPDWEFRFCGVSVESEGWSRILQQGNVRYFGTLPPKEFARHMCESTVGIIPYIQDQWIRNSLPLKAYEYVACGLPVVTVPIAALERDVELMAQATTAEEFESAIRRVADTRQDPASLRKRRLVALANSYNNRFEKMTESLLKAKILLTQSRKRLRIAILYDCMGSMHVNTIREHLEAFEKYSHHVVTYIPSSPSFWKRPADEFLGLVDLNIFDIAIVHYSTRLSIKDHIEEGLARALEHFHGLKVLFIQDEYEGTEIARSWMDRLRFDLVYTCVPQSGLNYVYPEYRFPVTEFLPTLTGYVPEDQILEQYAIPLVERKLLFAYRGRKLPAIYGELGQEKYRIGVMMKKHADARGFPVDIEVDDSKRIYGSGWYKFLGSARATLGTESGANVFDFDGSLRQQIKRLEEKNPAINFEEISAAILAPHEGRVLMNQISPKIFEAIRLRTALVLFEGAYSDVVRPDEHYIPLKKDYSNVEEVFAKIQNDEYLQSITDRAYQDVVASGRYSYKNFVEGIDSDLEARVLRSVDARVQLFQGPLFTLNSDCSLKQVMPILPVGLISGPHPLGKRFSRVNLSVHEGFTAVKVKGLVVKILKLLIPTKLTRTLLSSCQGAIRGNSIVSNAARFVWQRMPYSIQSRIRAVVIHH